MTILQRYICKTASAAFILTLAVLTGVIWVTQSLRELDLVTGKGQTLLIFLRVTILSLPSLIMLIAPFALFIAIIYTMNKLNGDSELIVMNAAGMSPASVLKPLFILTVIVSLATAFISLYAMPASFRTLRDLVTKIRSDVVTSVVQEGRFITLDRGITFHYREKGPGGTLVGILVQDRRDTKTSLTYIAERGLVTEVQGSPYLILEKGSLQRQTDKQADSAIVAFERYAIDMDQFGADGGSITYKPRERSTLELLSLDPKAPEMSGTYGRFRAELHDRFVNPLYPFAVLAAGFVALGSARNTRQSRTQAIIFAIIAVIAMRISSFGASTLAVRSAGAVALIYLVPVLMIVLCCVQGYFEFGVRGDTLRRRTSVAA